MTRPAGATPQTQAQPGARLHPATTDHVPSAGTEAGTEKGRARVAQKHITIHWQPFRWVDNTSIGFATARASQS